MKLFTKFVISWKDVYFMFQVWVIELGIYGGKRYDYRAFEMRTSD